MKYILCEDSDSGFYFWKLINQVFFNDTCIVKGFNGIGSLVIHLENMDLSNDKNIYLVCFDNAIDNKSVKKHVSRLQKVERKYPTKILLTNYICFEQVVLSSTNIGRFIPNVLKDARYNIMLAHIRKDYSNVQDLLTLCETSGLKKSLYATSERFFRPLLEDNCIISNTKDAVTKVNNTIMTHHYIYKGAWSECWTTDCTPNCPQEYCWKALHENVNLDYCNVCQNHLKNYTCKYSESFYTKRRKYEEDVSCNHELPSKLSDRVKLLFEDSLLKVIIGI